MLARAKGFSEKMVAACLKVRRWKVCEACRAASHETPTGPFPSRAVARQGRIGRIVRLKRMP